MGKWTDAKRVIEETEREAAARRAKQASQDEKKPPKQK